MKAFARALAFCVSLVCPWAAGAPFAWFPNLGNATVSVVDVASGSVIATVPVGQQPEGVAAKIDGTRVYVANRQDATISVVDAATRAVVATIPVGTDPRGIALNGAGTVLYVVHGGGLSIVDTATNTVTSTASLGAGLPFGIAVSPDGTRAYVTRFQAGSLAIVNTANGSQNTLGGFDHPTMAAVSGDGARIYVANSGNDTVSVVDAKSLAIVATIAVGDSPYAIALNNRGTRAYVSNVLAGTVSVIDTASLAVVATIDVGGNVQGLAVSPDGSRVLVAVSSSNLVAILDTATNAVIGSIAGLQSPIAYGRFVGGPFPPGPPGGVSVTQGATQATVRFSPPTLDGGSPITSYTATCQPGGLTASGVASPLVVTGLGATTAYNCSVAATNAIGIGGSAAAANDTVFFFQSQPGDYIGGGQTIAVRAADGYTVNTTATYDPAPNAVHVGINKNGYTYPAPLGLWWDIYLKAPGSAPLTPGIYEGATRYPFQEPSHPGLTFSGDGRGCNQSSGRFEILEIVFDSLVLRRLAVNFEQHCENGATALFGQVRFNSSVPVDTARRHPDLFSFPAQKDVVPGAVVTSFTATIAGIDVALPVSITGGEYSINSGAFTAAAGTISNGQTIKVRLTAASEPNKLRTAYLDLGGMVVPFNVGTAPGAAPQPNGDPLMVVVSQSASATATTVMSPATLHTLTLEQNSSGITVASVRTETSYYATYSYGFSGPSGAALAPGTYTSSYSGPPGQPTFSSSTPYSCYFDWSVRFTVIEVAFAAGGQPDKLALDFTQTCGETTYIGHIRFNSVAAIDYSIRMPYAFSFDTVTGASLGAMTQSSEITVQGISVPVAVSVANGEYSIDGGAFTATAGTIASGQRLRLRRLAPAQPNALATMTVTVGERTVGFAVASDPGPTPQPAGQPLMVFIAQPGMGSTAGFTRVLSPATLATFTIARSGNGISFNGQIALGYSEYWQTMFAGASGSILQPGEYPAAGYPAPTMPLLAVNGTSAGCFGGASGHFHVHEAEYATDGSVIRFAVDFVEFCGINPAALRGYLRYNSTVPIDYTNRLPNPISFSTVTDVAPGAVVTSQLVTIEGINVTVPISVANGEYRIDSGAFTSVPGTIGAGQTVTLRMTAPAVNNVLATASLTVGERTANFKVGTAPGSNPQPQNSQPLLVIASEAGDVIGQGQNYVYSAATLAQFGTTSLASGRTHFTLSGPSTAYWDLWTLDFATATGGPLIPGTYANALNPAVTGSPSLFVYHNGSCTTGTASFVVHEVEYAVDGTVLKLAVDFAQACGASSAMLRGYLRINSSVTVAQPPDTSPTPFSFTFAYNQPRGVVVTSNSVTIAGVTVAVPVSITGGEYSVNGGTFTGAPGMISAGQTLQVRLTTAATFGAFVSTAVTVGGYSTTFGATTEFSDSTPAPFSFPAQSGVALGQLVTSAPVTITGFNQPIPVYVASGEYSLGCTGTFVSAAGILDPGQSVCVRHMSAATYGTTTTTILVVNGVNGYFTSTTLSAHTLSVSKTGTGGGVVTSSPSGIACGPTCSAAFPAGSTVTLAANASSGATFSGWTGACVASSGACTVTMNAAAAVTAIFDSHNFAPQDFDDDGRSDLLWKSNADGSVQGWRMNGLTVTQVAGLLPANGGYSVMQVADLDGDGRADLAIKAADDRHIGWLMNGLDVAAQGALGPSGSPPITHTGDFNGDGKADFIYHFADGVVELRLMNGLVALGSANLVNPGSGWAVVKVADLDGDGKDDLLWQHTSGAVQLWLMDGIAARATAAPVSSGSGWSIVLTADLDGDGKQDVVWQHSDGTVQAWLMDGIAIRSVGSFASAGSGWTPTHAGDIDGDGKADLFWKHTSGATQTWLMNGLAVTGIASFTGAGSWSVAQLLDLNGDGKKDVLWAHTDGSVQAWLMSGLSILQIGSLSSSGPYVLIGVGASRAGP